MQKLLNRCLLLCLFFNSCFASEYILKIRHLSSSYSLGRWDGHKDIRWSASRDIDILSFCVIDWSNGWGSHETILFSDFRWKERIPVSHSIGFSQHGRESKLCLKSKSHGEHHHKPVLPINLTLRRLETGEEFSFDDELHFRDITFPQIKAAGSRDGYVIIVNIHHADLIRAESGEWSNCFTLRIFNDYFGLSEKFHLHLNIPALVKIGFSGDIELEAGKSPVPGTWQGITGLCVFTNSATSGYRFKVSHSEHYNLLSGFRLCLGGHCFSGAVPYNLGLKIGGHNTFFEYPHKLTDSFFLQGRWFETCDAASVCGEIIASSLEQHISKAKAGYYSDTVHITVVPD